MLVPAVVAVGLFAADALHGLDRGFLSNDTTDRALRMAEAGALALVAAGVALARWRAHRTRAALARLVLDIGAAPAPGELRTWLADSLGDPSLELLHRLDGGEWIDADGRPADLPTAGSRETTRVRAGGADVLAMVHRPGLLDDPDLLSELVTTARLALEHEALHAARRARLEELRASRARLVAAADAKRRELERDLHDGAQQRLVAVALRSGWRGAGSPTRTRSSRPGSPTAEENVRAAAVQLRDVAHGLFPAVLAEEGLRAALDELSEQTPRLVPRDLPDRRFDEQRRVGRVLRRPRIASIHRRRCDRGGRDREWRICGSRSSAGAGSGGAVTQIRDRVGAVGGTVTVADRELRLEMPCES